MGSADKAPLARAPINASMANIRIGHRHFLRMKNNMNARNMKRENNNSLASAASEGPYPTPLINPVRKSVEFSPPAAGY